MYRHTPFAVVLALVTLATLATDTVWAGGKLWTNDFEEAMARAKTENRFVLIDFTGSDWCGWCIKLDEEVFSEREFKKFAEDNLVCVVADFPRQKRLPKKVKEQNRKLADTYKVRGYPTVIILSPDGQKIAQTGYKRGGADAYVEHLESLIAPHRKGEVGNATGTNTNAGKLEMRTWTDVKNRRLEGKLVALDETHATLQTKGDKETKIARKHLSWWDRGYLEQHADHPALRSHSPNDQTGEQSGNQQKDGNEGVGNAIENAL